MGHNEVATKRQPRAAAVYLKEPWISSTFIPTVKSHLLDFEFLKASPEDRRIDYPDGTVGLRGPLVIGMDHKTPQAIRSVKVVALLNNTTQNTVTFTNHPESGGRMQHVEQRSVV